MRQIAIKVSNVTTVNNYRSRFGLQRGVYAQTEYQATFVGLKITNIKQFKQKN